MFPPGNLIPLDYFNTEMLKEKETLTVENINLVILFLGHCNSLNDFSIDFFFFNREITCCNKNVFNIRAFPNVLSRTVHSHTLTFN